jgi:hypothetical protein
MIDVRVTSDPFAAGPKIKQVDQRLSVLGSLPKQILQSESEAGEHRATLEIIADLENPYTGRRVINVNLAGTGINDPDLVYARAKVLLDFLGHLIRGVSLADDLDREIGNDFPGLGLWNAATKWPALGRDERQVGPSLEAESGVQQKKGLGHDAPQLILLGVRSHPTQKEGSEKGLKDTHCWLVHNLPANDFVEQVV